MRLATHGSKVRFYLHTMNTQQRVSGMSCRWKFAHSSRPVMKAGLLAALAFSCATPPASAQKMLRLTLPRGGVLTPVQKLNQKGVEQIEKRNYEGAEKSFYKAYLYDPSDPFTLNNLGYISEVQGRVDEAEKFYQLAVEQGSYATIDSSTEKNLKGKPMMDALGTLQNLPMRINRINVLGMQLLMQKRPFEAQTVFEQALALDPSNAFTLNNLGVADESTGDFESALKHYEAAADAHSTTPLVVTLDRSARGKPLSEVAANSATDLRKRMDKMDPDQIRSTMRGRHQSKRLEDSAQGLSGCIQAQPRERVCLEQPRLRRRTGWGSGRREGVLRKCPQGRGRERTRGPGQQRIRPGRVFERGCGRKP
jgi:tetratricopeptide (TPR) repeat protein